jgi:hypothetical protein
MFDVTEHFHSKIFYIIILYSSLRGGGRGGEMNEFVWKMSPSPIHKHQSVTDKQGMMIVITAINYRLSQNVMVLIEAVFHKCSSPFPHSSRLPVGNHWNACNKETRDLEYINPTPPSPTFVFANIFSQLA